MANPAQIAFPFFADIPNKYNVHLTVDLSFAHCHRNREQRRYSSGIVADARAVDAVTILMNSNVGTWRKDGIEMSGDRDSGSCVVPSWQNGDNIAEFIDR